eukprot:scaffold28499_cov36-Prasinocladus_malaysianus.AAC.1
MLASALRPFHPPAAASIISVASDQTPFNAVASPTLIHDGKVSRLSFETAMLLSYEVCRKWAETQESTTVYDT